MIQLNYYDFKNDYILLTNFYHKQDVLLNIRLLKYINMENNDNLFLLNHPDYDDIHRMCSDAYTKGRMVEGHSLLKHTDYVVVICLATDV